MEQQHGYENEHTKNKDPKFNESYSTTLHIPTYTMEAFREFIEINLAVRVLLISSLETDNLACAMIFLSSAVLLVATATCFSIFASSSTEIPPLLPLSRNVCE